MYWRTSVSLTVLWRLACSRPVQHWDTGWYFWGPSELGLQLVVRFTYFKSRRCHLENLPTFLLELRGLSVLRRRAYPTGREALLAGIGQSKRRRVIKALLILKQEAHHKYILLFFLPGVESQRAESWNVCQCLAGRWRRYHLLVQGRTTALVLWLIFYSISRSIYVYSCSIDLCSI